MPGVYFETVNMKNGVSVIGAGADSTFIDPGISGNGVNCLSIGPETLLVGFTITGGKTGVYCHSSTLEIRENVITNMDVTSLAADGIRLDDASPLIRNNVIHRVGGMGIRGQGNSSPRIINNTINDYRYYAAISFAALNIGAVTPIIKNNIITRGNTSPVGGILWKVPAAPVIDYNDVVDPANVTGDGSYYAEHDGNMWHEMPGGIGSLSLDPLYVSLPTTNLRLSPGSPCIDAGDPAAVFLDYDSTRNDMGAYGGQRLDSGVSSHPGTGFIFTGIGNVPITEIDDNPASSTHGLLQVSDAVAASFHIPKYVDSPFGGVLWLHGLFGALDEVEYYQIVAAPYGTSATETLTDPLYKTNFTINPDGSVTSTRVHMGPMTVGGVPNVYLLNKSGYWTFTDLRHIWNTTGLNGKYSVAYKAYHQPIVGGGLVEVPLLRNELDHFTIEINNTPVQIRIEDIAYADHTPILECEKIVLPHNADSRLIFTISAWHPEGYLRYYLLNCFWGNGNFGGQFAYDQYLGAHDAAPPLWQGVQNHELPPLPPMDGNWNPVPWHSCAYRFHMEGSTRVTDGYSYLYWSTDEIYQTVVYPTGMYDLVPMMGDGDVNSQDLLEMVRRINYKHIEPFRLFDFGRLWGLMVK
jgi:parallel beta-helix repeat protein